MKNLGWFAAAVMLIQAPAPARALTAFLDLQQAAARIGQFQFVKEEAKELSQEEVIAIVIEHLFPVAKTHRYPLGPEEALFILFSTAKDGVFNAKAATEELESRIKAFQKSSSLEILVVYDSEAGIETDLLAAFNNIPPQIKTIIMLKGQVPLGLEGRIAELAEKGVRFVSSYTPQDRPKVRPASMFTGGEVPQGITVQSLVSGWEDLIKQSAKIPAYAPELDTVYLLLGVSQPDKPEVPEEKKQPLQEARLRHRAG